MRREASGKGAGIDTFVAQEQGAEEERVARSSLAESGVVIVVEPAGVSI